MPTRHPILQIIASLLVPFVATSPAFSMRATESTEGPTALSVEKRLKAGAEEITLLIEPGIRKGSIVGQPEPYQPARKVSPYSPDIWRDTTLRQAAWVVLKDVEAVEGTGKDNQGKAVIRLPSLGKPIVTTAPWAKAYNQKLTVRVRPDPAGGLPQVLAVYNQANEIVDGIRVYVDTGDLKIVGGGPKKDEPYAFLIDEIGPDLWSDPRVDNETVNRFFLRGVPAHSSRGWSVLRIGEETEVVTKGRYSTVSNRTLLVEITRDPEVSRQWLVARVFNGARENISPDFSKSDIRVYLDKAPENGQVPSGSRSVMTTSLLGPTFWGNPEVMAAQTVLLEGVPVRDFNGVAGVKVGQRQIILTDLPFSPDSETQLLIYARPTNRQGLPFVEAAFSYGQKVYPAPKTLISVNPVIVQGRIVEAERQFWLDSDKVDAGQFWNLAGIKDAESVAWSGGSIQNSSGHAAVRVGDTDYRSHIPFQSLEGDRLLIVARPETRELISAFRLLNAERVPFRKEAAGLEEAAGVLAAAISDLKSELSQVAVPGRAVRMGGNPRALIVTSDGLFKLSAAPAFLIQGEGQFRIEALAPDDAHREQVRAVLGGLGFTNYRVYNVEDFGGELQAVSALQNRLSQQFDLLLVTAASGMEEVARFLGIPEMESSTRALETTADRYRSLWS